MVKITKLPHIIRYHGKDFKKIFNNNAQYQHFRRYLTGLMVIENKTLSAIQSKYIDSTSTNSLDQFMIHSDWSEEELNRKRVSNLQRRPETASKPSGVICIDDTLSHKTGKQMEDVEWIYDHSQGKYVLAHNLVTSHYKDGQVNYALDYRLYHRKPKLEDLQEAYKKLDKQIDLFDPRCYFIEKLKLLGDYRKRQLRFKTKIQLAIELIHQAESMGIKAKTYVFDCWFLCKKLTKVIRSYGKDWVSVLKSNRKLVIANKQIRVDQYIATLPKQGFGKIKTKQGKLYWVFTKSVRVSSLGKVRIVVSYDNPTLREDPLVLVTNRRDWEPVKILSTYAQRGSIDSFYRDAKQHLGLEDYQLRSIKGTKRHWYFVFLAHSFLMLNVMNSKLIKRLRANISTIGQSSRALVDEITMSLILWVYRNFQNQRSVDDVIQCLLN